MTLSPGHPRSLALTLCHLRVGDSSTLSPQATIFPLCHPRAPSEGLENKEIIIYGMLRRGPKYDNIDTMPLFHQLTNNTYLL